MFPEAAVPWLNQAAAEECGPGADGPLEAVSLHGTVYGTRRLGLETYGINWTAEVRSERSCRGWLQRSGPGWRSTFGPETGAGA